MVNCKAVTIHYQRILITVTTVLISNEETKKNCIFGTAMPGHQESLKLRPRPRVKIDVALTYFQHTYG